MTRKLHFWGGKKLKNFANISIFDPMKILRSNFLQLIRVARFNLELETVESIKKDPFLEEIWTIFESMVKSWVS